MAFKELKKGERELRAAEYFELEPAMDYWQCFWGPDDRGLENTKDSVRFAYDSGYAAGMKAERDRLKNFLKALDDS